MFFVFSLTLARSLAIMSSMSATVFRICATARLPSSHTATLFIWSQSIPSLVAGDVSAAKARAVLLQALRPRTCESGGAVDGLQLEIRL